MIQKTSNQQTTEHTTRCKTLRGNKKHTPAKFPCEPDLAFDFD